MTAIGHSKPNMGPRSRGQIGLDTYLAASLKGETPACFPDQREHQILELPSRDRFDRKLQVGWLEWGGHMGIAAHYTMSR